MYGLQKTIKRVIGHGLIWNALRKIHGAWWWLCHQHALPLPQQPAPPLQGPYVVIGVLRAASGIGESARLTLAALQKLGVEPLIYDVSENFNQAELPPDPGWRNAYPWPEHGTLILHMNAPEIPHLLLHLGNDKIKNKRLIGAWAWELPRAPQSWLHIAKYMHEIWACSHFAARAMKAITHIPVKAVFIPVAAPPKINGKKFAIPENVFTVLAMGNAHSSLHRKNPFGAIAAFKQAFGDDANTLLILHIGRLDSMPAAKKQLLRAVGHAPNIRLIQDTLTNEDRFALIGRADTVISLHRAEGFGLLMAEAMLLGKAVVATGWSANMDFMDNNVAAIVGYDLVPVQDDAQIYNAPDLTWAEPHVLEAAEWLKKLHAEPALRMAMGIRAASHAEAFFSAAHYREQTGI